MNKLKWGWAIGLMLAAPASADLVRIKCTAPTQNNSGSCVSPTLSTANTRDSIWVVINITGETVARRDSVWRRPGGAIDLTYNLPRGTYIIEAMGLRVSVDGTKYYGCPAQITTIAQTATPWRPTFGP